jgi:hypothetical protein
VASLLEGKRLAWIERIVVTDSIRVKLSATCVDKDAAQPVPQRSTGLRGFTSMTILVWLARFRLAPRLNH